MAIESINTSKVTNTVQQVKSATKNTVDTNNQENKAIANDDTVSIKNMPAHDANAPVVDEVRTANVKAAIQSGSYSVNPERVAGKMMQLDLKLPNTT